jgi:hypothetical protein
LLGLPGDLLLLLLRLHGCSTLLVVDQEILQLGPVLGRDRLAPRPLPCDPDRRQIQGQAASIIMFYFRVNNNHHVAGKDMCVGFFFVFVGF